MIGIYRILDANVNRVCEGIRVVEDIMRFHFEDAELTEKFRNARHILRKTFIEEDIKFIDSRDSEHDIGKDISGKSTLDKKTSLKQLLMANFKRVTEGLRVIEESTKIINEYQKSKKIESLRYEAYYLEKEVMKKFKLSLPEGLYGITCEKFGHGRNNIEQAKLLCEAGIKIIQYREKYKSLKERIEEAKEIRKITREYGVIFIVNDNVEIASLVDADGVHIGQDDLPIKYVRELLGEKIIGLSTHSPEQAEQAVKDGADYIGVGPIFSTQTKDNVCDPVGFEYLEYVVKNINIPFVAIGGIKFSNMKEVLKRGAKSICLVSEITDSENIKETVDKLNEIIREN